MTGLLAAPGVPAPLDGFGYRAPRFLRYLLQERTNAHRRGQERAACRGGAAVRGPDGVQPGTGCRRKGGCGVVLHQRHQ